MRVSGFGWDPEETHNEAAPSGTQYGEGARSWGHEPLCYAIQPEIQPCCGLSGTGDWRAQRQPLSLVLPRPFGGRREREPEYAEGDEEAPHSSVTMLEGNQIRHLTDASHVNLLNA